MYCRLAAGRADFPAHGRAGGASPQPTGDAGKSWLRLSPTGRRKAKSFIMCNGSKAGARSVQIGRASNGSQPQPRCRIRSANQIAIFHGFQRMSMKNVGDLMKRLQNMMPAECQNRRLKPAKSCWPGKEQEQTAF